MGPHAARCIVAGGQSPERAFERTRSAAAFRRGGQRLAVLALLSPVLTSCALHEFTTDLSLHARAKTVVGQCFSLRQDAFVLEAPRRITIEKPQREEFDVYGVISVWEGARSDPRQVLRLPAGTHLSVERVLSRYSPMVGDALTTYGRLSGQLDDRYLDSSELFEFTFAKDPVLPVRAYLAPCE